MNVDQKIEELIDSAALARKEKAISEIGYTQLDSPIEKLLMAAFVAREIHTSHFFTMRVWAATRPLSFEYLGKMHETNFPNWCVSIVTQVTVGEFRVDFLAIASRRDQELRETERLFLAIECDGHEFHEKTREQAARDKARDRYLVTRNIPVMRFTGSEIWRDANQCVGEILDFFEEKIIPRAQVA